MVAVSPPLPHLSLLPCITHKDLPVPVPVPQPAPIPLEKWNHANSKFPIKTHRKTTISQDRSAGLFLMITELGRGGKKRERERALFRFFVYIPFHLCIYMHWINLGLYIASSSDLENNGPPPPNEAIVYKQTGRAYFFYFFLPFLIQYQHPTKGGKGNRLSQFLDPRPPKSKQTYID